MSQAGAVRDPAAPIAHAGASTLSEFLSLRLVPVRPHCAMLSALAPDDEGAKTVRFCADID